MRKEHCCVFLDNLENKYCSAAVELGQELQLSLNIIRLLLEEGSACVCVVGTSPECRNAMGENMLLARSF